MSRALPFVGNSAGGYRHLQNEHRTASNAAAQTDSIFVDGSDALFSIYLERADEEDKMMAESWKADADGILVFTGLFSAAVATFIGVSIQDLKQNSQDTSAFYLQTIYQVLADVNRSQTSIPSALSTPPPFSPPTSAVWVNSLWFLSFSVSLTCALLATLLQRWARRYLQVTRHRRSLHKRARIRAFFSEGINKLHLPWAVEALPTLLHVALFLFFMGLVLFLYNINHTVFTVVISWVGTCACMYACITFMPIVRHDSPYYAPLSSSAWFIVTGLLYVIFRFFGAVIHLILGYRGSSPSRELETVYYQKFSDGMDKTAEQTAQVLLPGIDCRALLWTFETLDEDHELERFFAGVPDFCSSKTVQNPRRNFIEPNHEQLSASLVGWVDRTLLSNLVPEEVKQRRITVCIRAANATALLQPWDIIEHVLSGRWHEFLKSARFGLAAQKWGHTSDPLIIFGSQCVVAATIASVHEHDESWFRLVLGQLDVPESVLRNYLGYGDSALLANLTSMVRRMIDSHSELGEPYDYSTNLLSSRTLQLACEFDAQRTLPGLQQEFYGLWNQLVRAAQNDEDLRTRSFSVQTLKYIRRVFLALREGQDVPTIPFSTSTSDHDPILDWASSYPMYRPRDTSLHHMIRYPSLGEGAVGVTGEGQFTPPLMAPIPRTPPVASSSYDPLMPHGVLAPHMFPYVVPSPQPPPPIDPALPSAFPTDPESPEESPVIPFSGVPSASELFSPVDVTPLLTPHMNNDANLALPEDAQGQTPTPGDPPNTPHRPEWTYPDMTTTSPRPVLYADALSQHSAAQPQTGVDLSHNPDEFA